MKVLVTGAGGFVGSYLVQALREKHQVIGLDRSHSDVNCDVTDAEKLAAAVAKVKPDWVVHLAGQPFVPLALKDPQGTRKINVTGTKNLLLACVAAGIKPKVLLVSSAHVYGTPHELPLTEESLLLGTDPYSLSRIEQEDVAKMVAAEHGIPLVISRSFNHTGPGQSANFVVPSIARQVAAIERGVQKELVVGNTEPRRDFTDVRDVVRAYVLALEKAAPGTYNVCSGRAYSVQQIIDMLGKMTAASLVLKHDTSLTRANDIPELVGSHDKFSRETGWQPRIPFEKTLGDILEYWRGKQG